jgi:hypothetical protein
LLLVSISSISMRSEQYATKFKGIIRDGKRIQDNVKVAA